MRYGRQQAVAPERQRKIDALVAAASARGVPLGDYEPLAVGGGSWRAKCAFRLADGLGREANVWGIERDEFGDLIATFTDDTRWAAWAHDVLGRGYHEDAISAYHVYHYTLDYYGRACANLLRASIEGQPEERQGELAVTVEAVRHKVTDLYRELERRRLIAKDYDATLPATGAAVREYLGRLTIRKE